jgi:protein arginine kinase activator
VGKVPARARQSIERETQVRALQRDLRKAVAAEDYESAAQLRDKLKQFTGS